VGSFGAVSTEQSSTGDIFCGLSTSVVFCHRDDRTVATASKRRSNPHSNLPEQVLFATHFHELTRMERSVEGVTNLHVAAHAPADASEITMLYEVRPGPSERSFGIHVARVARFPQEIVDAAEVISAEMESRSKKKQKTR
jgi:hypothetical protein